MGIKRRRGFGESLIGAVCEIVVNGLSPAIDDGVEAGCPCECRRSGFVAEEISLGNDETEYQLTR